MLGAEAWMIYPITPTTHGDQLRSSVHSLKTPQPPLKQPPSKHKARLTQYIKKHAQTISVHPSKNIRDLGHRRLTNRLKNRSYNPDGGE
jgi:hypothetical protein